MRWDATTVTDVRASATPRAEGLDSLRSAAVRDWFEQSFPGGPSPAQSMAWPFVAARENVLLISPTGTGKTLAAFLAIIDRLMSEHDRGDLADTLRVVYVSPLRSLGYDIEKNLRVPLSAIPGPIRIGVRTGDTTATERRKLRERPPHLLITTPESLSLMLSQASWRRAWKSVDTMIVDEIHSLVPTKRGADLAISLERLSAAASRDPARIGLSATCRPPEPVASFLVGAGRSCRILEAGLPESERGPVVAVESLLEPDEAPYRALTYRRLIKRVLAATAGHRTTVVFANTRALTERITHDLREFMDEAEVAAHHSALDAARRREVEARLKSGDLRVVVTSTSLELGVDIGTADLSILVGLPGSVARCLQRVGRSGHRLGAQTRGVLLAATPSELAGGVATAQSARRGEVEPLSPIRAPLDVLCQQLIGLACEGEQSADDAFALIRRAAPMSTLERSDFDSCLDFLSGDLPSPSGAFEPEPGATPRFTSPRLWRTRGLFGLRSSRVARWFRSNVGTITSEESVRVMADGQVVGSLEAAYAERLARGDRFVLDGRALEFRKLDGLTVHALRAGGDPALPRWTSDRQGLSAQLAMDVARFRERARSELLAGPEALGWWLQQVYGLDPASADVLVALHLDQERFSEVPSTESLLIEESPCESGWSYAFHAPLSRSACEALGRAAAARAGRVLGRDLELTVADLGWSFRLPVELRLDPEILPQLVAPERFDEDVLEGLDRGELVSRRFRHVASTALMVLRRPDGGRTRVGGMLWVSQRLFPLVKAACPDHPLLRETRREVLEDILDAPTALDWLSSRPSIRFRRLDAPSPFCRCWIDQGAPDILRFEDPSAALQRLHRRLNDRTGSAR